MGAMDRFPSTACCNTFFIAKYAKGPGIARFRTYLHGNARAADCTVVEAALATSAAPSVFEPVTIKFSSSAAPVTYLDGRVGAKNNPAEQAIIAARQILGAEGAIKVARRRRGRNSLPKTDKLNKKVSRVRPWKR